MVEITPITNVFFEGVSHHLRYPFCPGYQLITRQDQDVPHHGFDKTPANRPLTAVCHHNSDNCNSNTEMEWYFRNKVFQGRISHRQLTKARPNHWASPKGAKNRPNYAAESEFNYNSRCPNFRVLIHNNLPKIGPNGYPVTVPCTHEDPKTCQFEASSIYTFGRLMRIKGIRKRDFMKFFFNSWAHTINRKLQESDQTSVSDVYYHQSCWPGMDDVLWSPADLIGLDINQKFRFVIPPLGLYSYNTYQSIEKDEYGLMVPHASFDTVYMLEYQLIRIHFTTRNRQNSLFTDSSLCEDDEFFKILDEIVSGYNELPEPDFSVDIFT